MIKSKKCLTVLFSLLALSLSVQAEMSTAELIKKSQARAKEIKELKALLNSPDQVTRLTILEAMLSSGDITTRELAFAQGFASADDTMRALTLKHKFKNLEWINVSIDYKRAEGKAGLDAAKNRMGSLFKIPIRKYDIKTGKFENGKVSGIRVDFSPSYFSGSLILTEGSLMKGKAVNTYSSPIPVDIELAIH